MTHLSVVPTSDEDARPLPLIVAERWNFPLAHLHHEQALFYAVQDWIRGLTGEANIRNMWSMFKKTEAGQQTLNSIVRLPCKASDGKTYQRDYATNLATGKPLLGH